MATSPCSTVEISPGPTDDEAAAIVAALMFVGQPPVPPEGPPALTEWRFSGRWWHRASRYVRR